MFFDGFKILRVFVDLLLVLLKLFKFLYLFLFVVELLIFRLFVNSWKYFYLWFGFVNEEIFF